MAPSIKVNIEGKHLTFQMGKEMYGLDIMKVREIVGLLPITAVPRSAGHMRGVINLRGKIIPVLDMRRKFGLPDVEATKETCIITVSVRAKGGDLLVGLLVDAVSEVTQIGADEVEAMPELGGMALDYVTGVVKSKGRVVILLDIDRVVQGDELAAILAAA